MGVPFRWFAQPSRAACLAAIAVVGVCAGFSTGVLRAQAQQAKTMLVEPPTPLLPATLGKLARVAAGDVGDGLGKLDAAGLSAQDKAVVTEDGLKRFAQSDYAPSGKEAQSQGSITAYKFVDASGAISAYDYLRKPGMRSEKVADDAASSGDDLLVRSGVCVVQAKLKLGHEASVALINELIDHLPKTMGPAALAPLLPTLLPAKGLDAASIKYALGPAGYQAMGGVLPVDAVGFNKSAETVTASYHGGTLTLLLYPTPQIAGEYGRDVQSALQHDGAAAGTVKLRRDGPLVVLTTGAWSADAAQKMVDSVQLRSEVTFDKPLPPEFHAEVKKTFSLLMNITIFCCICGLGMLALGLFLGGGRALIRVMQGKPAASEPEFLRIDLREASNTSLRHPKH